MKLLILTQKIDINDDVLGFFHGWVAEFAKHCEQVTVICLYKGEYDLPTNVKVLSLGKEENISAPLRKGPASRSFSIGRVRGIFQLRYAFRFYKYIWQERKNYDAVFVHMNQIYVILGGLLWRAWRKKISLWYTHKQVSLSLKIAEKLVDNIFTASKESFRLTSKKVQVMGHGINTEIFKPLDNKETNQKFSILTVGRISPIKDIKTLVRAIAILKEENIELKIVGAPGTPEQEDYLQEIKDLVKENKLEEKVVFVGPVSNWEVIKYFQKADLFVNLSGTGSVDKAVLEAMACGCISLTCNEAFLEILSDFKELMFSCGNCDELSKKIKTFQKIDFEKRQAIVNQLRHIVVEDHNLEKLIKRLLNIINV